MNTEITDPEEIQWGYSLANVIEIMRDCLEVRGTRSLLEIGSYTGELTSRLLDWGTPKGVDISVVEPLPPEELGELIAEHPELTLIEDTGVAALEGLEELPDVVILDGDHNYYTLSAELAKIAERSGEGPLPLLMFHDVCWPHDRRDTYYAPERVPESERQPLGSDCTIEPGNPGLSEDGGLPYEWAAAREGGPKNGVLTAIEDFMATRSGIRLAIVPLFFGFGLLWEESEPYAEDLARTIAPYDRNPVLARAEKSRVELLVATHKDAKLRHEMGERIHDYEEILNRMLSSSALGIAERITRTRQRGKPVFTRQQIQDLLDGKPGPR